MKLEISVVDSSGVKHIMFTNQNLTPSDYLHRANGGEVSGPITFSGNSTLSFSNKTTETKLISVSSGDAIGVMPNGGKNKLSCMLSNGSNFFLEEIWNSRNFNPSDKLNITGGTISQNLTVQGWFHANQNVTAFSDIRIKDNIQSITHEDYDKLMNVSCKSYMKYGRFEYGVIAQELENIFPHMVITTDTTLEGDSDPLKSVIYGEFIPLLIAKVQDQEKQLLKLEERLNALELRSNK